MKKATLILSTSALMLALSIGLVSLAYAVVPPAPEPDPVPGVTQVKPVLETRTVIDADEDVAPAGARLGSADDVAFWVNPKHRSKSLVIGTLKEGGIDVYDLNGSVVQTIAPAGVRYNNVDTAYDFKIGSRKVDIAVTTDRFGDSIAVYKIDPKTRKLTEITAPNVPMLFTPAGTPSNKKTTAYGMTLYRSQRNGCLYVFANRAGTGDVAQFKLIPTSDGKVTYAKVRAFSLPIPEGGELEDAQTEGMVADRDFGQLYIGQEQVGIWKVGAEPTAPNTPQLIHTVESDYLDADVEGLTIYYAPKGKGYLLCSSQGDNTFAVFKRTGGNALIDRFQIVPNAHGVDGAQDCDGAEVISSPMGPRFPNGLLVVQDGVNDPAFMVEEDGEAENQSCNFKYVPWERVARPLGLRIVAGCRPNVIR